jgi:hypothetical protein
MFYGGSSACPATGPGPSQRLALGVCVQPPKQPLTQQSSLKYRPRMGRDDSQRTRRQWKMANASAKKPKAKKKNVLVCDLMVPFSAFVYTLVLLLLLPMFSLSLFFCLVFTALILHFYCSTNNQTRRLSVCFIYSSDLCLSRWLCLTQQSSPPTRPFLIL